jgi:hypothetical protein
LLAISKLATFIGQFNILKSTFLFLFLVICPFIVIVAQTTAILTVVRPKGTSVYSKPDNSSMIISHLKFAEKVMLLNDFASGVVEKEGKLGYWIKVRSNNHEGFVFRNDLTNSVEVKIIEGDYAVIAAQNGALAEINFNPDLQYYAVVQHQNTQDLEKITVDFKVQVNPNGKEQVIIESDARETPIFYFGSARKLRSRWFEYYTLSEGQRELYRKNDSIPKTIRLIDNRVSLYTELKWAPKTEKELSYAQLLVKEEIEQKKTQRLFPVADYKPMDQYEYPIYLTWCGDIDGDKRADFLIEFGDVLKHYDLYLSSVAGKNKLLEKVASWNAALQL